MTFPSSHHTAIAGPYQNNCGLHAIAHSWLSLPENKIRTLAQTHPIYSIIFDIFYQHYGLSGQPDVEQILEFNKTFSHPRDREILWGPVLRQTLRDPRLRSFIPASELKNLADSKMVFHDSLAILTQLMGATLTIHNRSYRDYEKKHMPAVMTYQPTENAHWKIDLVYVGDHYNFSYSRAEKNHAHNQKWHQTHTALLYDEFFQQDSGCAYTQQQNQQFIKDMLRATANSLVDQGRYQSRHKI